MFGTDFSLLIGGERVPLSDFKFTPRREIDGPEVLTSYTTTNVTIEGELTMTPEQEEEATKWWADLMQRELERQLYGYPSEFQLSLRAAGSKV